MAKKNQLIGLIVDTVIVLIGFAIAISAAMNYFFTNDATNLLVFLFGFIVVCYGFGRRLKDYWK
jgi:hypothetical protein